MPAENRQKEKNRFIQIDKTAALESALGSFTSLYLEGAAASGKTTAVQMLADKHPEAVIRMVSLRDHKTPEQIYDETGTAPDEDQQPSGPIWTVFEDLPAELPKDICSWMVQYVRCLEGTDRVIFVSRHQPPGEFLELYWKGQMEILPQKILLFSADEVRQLTELSGSMLQPDELYRVTGGWPGCVNVMLRMSQGIRFTIGKGNTDLSADSLRTSYEIDTYIQDAILSTLSEQERQIMEHGLGCPWFDEDICREVWGMPDAQWTLEDLERKGLLIRLNRRKCRRLAPLFDASHEKRFPWGTNNLSGDPSLTQRANRSLGQWYEKNGYLREALWCFRQMDLQEEVCSLLLRHYDKVSYLGISFDEILTITENSPEICYLRGMCYRRAGKFQKMFREAERIGTEHPQLYINLVYANPEVSLEDWLQIVETLWSEKSGQGDREKFRLFDMLGFSHTFLCGIRDLTGLFACTRKEENRRAAVWKQVFGKTEWQAYCLARADYYLETERGKALTEEDRNVLEHMVYPERIRNIADSEGGWEQNIQNWKFGVVSLYVLCRLQVVQPEDERQQQLLHLSEALMSTDDPVCIHNAEAILARFSYVVGKTQWMGRWLLANDSKHESEMTITELISRIKGYLYLRQYEKAGRLLRKVIPYLQKYHLNNLHAEALFQQAIVCWSMERHGQALQNTIESFLINGSSRYVRIYTVYGTIGLEVLESYVEWLQNSASGGWKHKKKYNYGNVLRMPTEDYMEVILRRARKGIQKGDTTAEAEAGEKLTMMETIILQDLSRGLTNTQICEEQNLKLSTVKSHIYSLYKKLGVSNRTQAMLKGREMGIVK